MPGVLPTPTDCCSSPCGDEICVPGSLPDLITQSISIQLTWFIVTDSAYGALGDGTNDTDAIQAAYDAAVAAGGGILYFPRRGIYRFNLVVTDDNILIAGCGIHDVNHNTTHGFAPWDTSLPVIQVGDDTRVVTGFAIFQTAIFGEVSGVGAGALHLLGGSHGSIVYMVGMIGGAETLKFATGVTYPSALNTVEQCEMWDGYVSTVGLNDNRTGAGYCTGNKITDSYINGHNTLGYAIEMTATAGSGILNLANVYMDAFDDHAIHLIDGASLSPVNCDLECSTITGVLFHVEFLTSAYTENDISRFCNGGARIQGKVRWTDTNGTTTTNLPSGGGLNHALDRTSLRKPWISLPAYFGTVVGPYDATYNLDYTGVGGDLAWNRDDLADGIMNFTGGGSSWNFRVANGDTSSFLHIDFPELTTLVGNFRLFRGTNTTPNCRFDIFRGDGTGTLQHGFASHGDVALCLTGGAVGIGTGTATSILHVVGLPVYANNAAAIVGGLTAGAFYRVGGDPDQVCVVH